MVASSANESFLLASDAPKVKIKHATATGSMSDSKEVPSLPFLRHLLEELDSHEDSLLLFLCHDAAPGCTTVTQALCSLSQQRKLTLAALVEMLYVLQRMDLLKSRFGLSKEGAEQLLGTSFLTRYRKLMVCVGEELDSSELRALRLFACNLNPSLSTALSESSRFVELVLALENVGLVSPSSVSVLADMLRTLRRLDLCQQLVEYEQQEQARYRYCYAASPSLPVRTLRRGHGASEHEQLCMPVQESSDSPELLRTPVQESSSDSPEQTT